MEPICTCCGALTDGSGCDACALRGDDGRRCTSCYPEDAALADDALPAAA